MSDIAYTLTRLEDLAVVSLTGTDAGSFLQSQLTQDVDHLGPGRAALAGYCTARGRLLASMIVLQSGPEKSDGWILLTRADAALAFAQRLRMFVLRADVNITISEVPALGVRIPRSGHAPGAEGPAATPAGLPATATDMLTLPDEAATPYTVVRQDARIWISTPERDNAPHARWWLLNAAGLEASNSDPDIQAWQADDIAAGLPWIQASTQETFIPQTINMDLIEGVSFTKGCYPGQEVVARSHYRGTVKRRMAYAVGSVMDADAVQALPGSDTFDANNPGRPCGRVINAALSGNTLHVLIEVQLADMDTADFRLGADDGPVVNPAALPYPIQSDKQE